MADYWRGAAAAPPPGADVDADDMAGGFLSELEAPPANSSAAKPLASLEALVVLGSSIDDVVSPWQSTFFGAAEGSEEVVPLRERRLYEDDWIGLRALDERGGLAVHDCHVHRAFDAALGDDAAAAGGGAGGEAGDLECVPQIS